MDGVPSRDPGPRRRVVVAVLTYRRIGELTDLLQHLCRDVESVNRTVPGRFTVGVVVVDNDPEGGAEHPVRRLGLEDVRYVNEQRPGIAAARNRALDEAHGADLLAFIDDDELPGDRWLEHLLETWEVTRAAAVPGGVVATYSMAPDPWLAAGHFFDRLDLPTGTGVAEAAAGNLLLDMNQIRHLAVRFNEAFGLSGGEDSLFSRQIIRAGGRIVWCNEALVLDRVPPSRMTREWVLQRAMSHGNTQRLIAHYLAPDARSRSLSRFASMGGGTVRVAAGALRTAYGRAAGRPTHHARGLRTAYRGMGMLAAAAGYVYEEYNREGSHRRGLRAFAPVPPGMRESQGARR
jgi:GT2 family glycosyltransferase